jgi:GNAT superfamily N-acetyltransferase
MRVVAVSNAKGEVTDAELLAAAERVHRQLRPHLGDYVGRMRQVLAAGAEMAVCVVEGEVAGITVFRVLERTFSGRELYCDDLVTDEKRRSTGVGRALVRFMEQVCRDRQCDTFALDSGVQRRLAHKFYFREGMAVTSFHFTKVVSDRETGINPR